MSGWRRSLDQPTRRYRCERRARASRGGGTGAQSDGSAPLNLPVRGAGSLTFVSPRCGSVVNVATRVLIDVDTGIDDALALLYAIAHPDLEVAAVTCVSGNVALSQVVTNTCSVLGVAGAPGICVGGGADASLRGDGPRTGRQHGADGLGDLRLPSSMHPQAGDDGRDGPADQHRNAPP